MSAPRRRAGSVSASIVRWLAVENNSEIVDRMGCSRQLVNRVRQQEGVRAPRTRGEVNAESRTIPCPDPSRLGMELDAALADEWGISKSTVRRMRRDYGVPGFSVANGTARAYIRDHAGMMTDAEMGAELGMSATSVCQHRKRMSLPPRRDVHNEASRAAIGEAKRRWWAERKAASK